MPNNNIAIYTRVSTHWQIDKDSLQVQQRELISYAKLMLGTDSYTIYEDAGYSGKNTDRPSYQRMMSDVRNGDFTHILVWKIDRISRNLLDFSEMYSELKKLGVTFVSKNEQFDTSTAIGEAMLKIILVFAELERQMTSERVTATMLSKATQGDWLGGRIPYGYNYDRETKEFSIDTHEAKIVKEMYSLYLKRESLLEVSRLLNDMGYTSRTSLWTPVTVRKILINPFYTGSYIYNVHKGIKGEKHDKTEWITIPNHHTAIVDSITQDAVRKTLTRNLKTHNVYNTADATTHVHIFAGLMTCGLCRANMTATPARMRHDGYTPSVYGCSTRRKSHVLCDNEYANDIIFGQFVFSIIATMLKLQGTVTAETPLTYLQSRILTGKCFDGYAIPLANLHEIRDKYVSCGPSVFEISLSRQSDARRTVLEAEKAKYETAATRLKNVYLYGVQGISEAEYIAERNKITQKLSDIESEISRLSNTENKPLMEKASLFIMQEMLASDNFDYIEMVKTVDPSVPKQFINTIVSDIVMTHKMPSEICFANGLKIIITESNKS